MPPIPHTVRSRGYLPHWEAAHATYSVTFRLGDSLPQEVLNAYLRERQNIVETAQQMQRELTWQEAKRLSVLFSERIEASLDQGAGACYLRDSRIGKMVFDALGFYHHQRYELFTWCVMPNHVHVLFSPMAPHTLDSVIQAWKSFTAHKADRILRRRGRFWMTEYYDHLIRDAADFRHAHRYILQNPEKAGLAPWPWVETYVEDATL